MLNWAGLFIGLLIMTGDYVVAGRVDEPRELGVPRRRPRRWSGYSWWPDSSPSGQTSIEPLWRWRSQLRLDYGLRQTHAIRLKLAAAIVFFALPGFFLVYVVPDSNLAHHDPKMGLVNLVAVIVALDRGRRDLVRARCP